MGVFFSIRSQIWTEKDTLFFPEGNGLLNDWTMLENALQTMGNKEVRGDSEKTVKTFSSVKSDKQKGGVVLDVSMKLTSPGRSRKETI